MLGRALGSLLGIPGRCSGGSLRGAWGVRWLLLANLSPTLRQLDANLGPTRANLAQLGPTWSQLGANLGPTRLNLGPFGCQLGAKWAPIRPKWPSNLCKVHCDDLYADFCWVFVVFLIQKTIDFCCCFALILNWSNKWKSLKNIVNTVVFKGFSYVGLFPI